MAKSLIRGLDWRLWRDKSATATPEWVEITAVDGLGVTIGKEVVEFPVIGGDTGARHGKGVPEFSFTMYEDTGDTDGVVALAAALLDDATPIKLAMSTGALTDASIPYWYLECSLFGDWDYSPGDPASVDVTGRLHPNSDQTKLEMRTTPAGP